MMGTLEIRLRKTRWRLWRYRWLERALSLGFVFILASGALGYFWERRQENLRQKVIGLLERQRVRLCKQHTINRDLARIEHERWLEQAMEWTSKSLFILDGNQRLVMANASALDTFHLTRKALGSHWLDHARSPEWAAALCQSVDNPDLRVSGPVSTHSLPTFLITYPKPGALSPESTWIVIG